MRYTLNAVLASPSPPDGFTIADLVAKVRSLTGQPELDYTVRQAAYDLRKLRGKQLVVKPDRTRRYHVPGEAARTIGRAAHPARAGHRPDPRRRPPSRTGTRRWHTPASIVTTTNRDGMRILFHDLAIATAA
jgi:hypothetical protein